MESTDEKIAKKQRQVREAEAKEKMKKHQKEISQKNKEAIAAGKNPYEVKGGMSAPSENPEPKVSKREEPKPKPKVTKNSCLLYTSPSPRDLSTSRMPSSA